MNKRSGKKIILDGLLIVPKEDRRFINDKDLSSEDLFRIFGFIAKLALGIEVVGYHSDPEESQTIIYLK